MGPENKNDCALFFGDVPIAQGQIQLPEITPSAEALESESAKWLMEVAMSVKPAKHWRCGNRKRFVKLMMSEGMGRNYAEWLAGFVRKMMPYGEAWGIYLFYKLWMR